MKFKINYFSATFSITMFSYDKFVSFARDTFCRLTVCRLRAVWGLPHGPGTKEKNCYILFTLFVCTLFSVHTGAAGPQWSEYGWACTHNVFQKVVKTPMNTQRLTHFLWKYRSWAFQICKACWNGIDSMNYDRAVDPWSNNHVHCVCTG
jgi:hypothetical protein